MDLGTTSLLIVVVIAVATLVFQRQANKHTKTIDDLSSDVAELNCLVSLSVDSYNKNFRGVEGVLGNHKSGIEEAHEKLGKARDSLMLLLRLAELLTKRVTGLHVEAQSAKADDGIVIEEEGDDFDDEEEESSTTGGDSKSSPRVDT